MELNNIIQDKLDGIKELRLKLYENAELSYKEFKTAEIIIDFLKELDIPTVKMAGTGVVGTLNEGEQCIAIRADMDALPVNGVSHACGHDYHMAIALGAAQVLREIGFKKCIKFIFQPAEEAEGGAVPMINEGVLENPSVKYMIGYHVWPELPVGKIEVGKGASMGSVDDFDVIFKGVGGHAALPHLCKNPIFPAMDLIQSITLKSRIETDPLNSHVITFGAFNAGTTNNVIPAEAVVKGTARTFDNDLRKKINEDVIAQAKISAEKYGCEAEVKYILGYPPVICDDELTGEFIEVSRKALGSENVVPLVKTLGAEDFAFFAEKVPSVHFRVGISNEEKGNHPLHSPYFDGDDEAIFYGIYSIVNFVLHLEDRI